MGKINPIKLIWFFCVILTSTTLLIVEQPSKKVLSQSIDIFSSQIQFSGSLNVSEKTVELEQNQQKIDYQTLKLWLLISVLCLTAIVAIGCRFFSLRSYRHLQQTEKALRESEARYRAIIEDQTELICRFLPDGTLTFVNDAYCRYFQKERSELVNHTFIPLIPKEDQEKVAQNLALICSDQPTITHEHRVILNNEIRWHQWTNRAIFDANKQVIEYQAVGRDITELKTAEAEIRSFNLELEQRVYLRTQEVEQNIKKLQLKEIALKESETRYRRLVEASPAIIYEFSNQRGGIYYSSHVIKVLGYSLSYLYKHPWLWHNSIHPEDQARITPIVKEIEQGKNFQVEYRIQDAAGKWHWFYDRSIGRRLGDNNELIIEGLAIDITDYKEAQIALTKVHQQLTFHVENTPLAVIEWDKNCKVKYWSSQAEKIFGWKAEEVIGLHWEEWKFVHEADQQEVNRIISDLMVNKKPRSFQCNRNYSKEGKVLECEWYNSILLDPQGELVSILSLVLNISDRKQMEAVLKESEAKYRLLFEANPNPLWVFDLETLKFLEVNEAAIRHYGYSREEFLRMTIVDLQPAENIPNLHHSLEEVQPNSDEHYNYGFWKHKKQNGEIIYVEILAQSIFFEGRFAKIIMATDITARVEAEKALSQSEERFRRAITDAPLPIIIHAEDGEVIQINQTWTDLSGYNHSEIPTIADWAEKAYGERKEMAQTVIDQLYAINSRIEEGEFLIKDATGKERVWNFSSAPLGILPDGRRQVISMAIDITERKEAEERLRYDALHDSVTGLPNRVLLMEQVEHCLQRAKLHPNYLFAVLFVDLDRFKVVNDSLGHLVGDQLLVAIAYKLKGCIRNSDIVARLGGDEFIILLDQLREPQEAVFVAQRICRTLESPFTLNEQEVFVTASIGITFNSSANQTAIDLLRNADLAMYRAKESGKARYAIFDPEMHIKISRQLELETNLRVALDHEEFLVYYQPIMSLQTLTLIGFEALVRWQHPEQGLISPNEFIPIAEETGLIVPLGEWVLNESCRQVKEWQTEFPQINFLQISVNLSSRQLQQLDLIQTIDSILARTGLSGSCLKLEITESLLMQNPETAIHTLLKLRERQIEISIDDFGTGYSSLSYLHRLPVDTLKIDRSFVSRMNEDGENLEIVEAIINLAHHLGVTVIAEGVESQEHFTKLKELGCESGQGYYFSRPINAQDIKRFLQDRTI